LLTIFLLVSCLANFSAHMMENTRSC
jgi:hypothetical protein